MPQHVGLTQVKLPTDCHSLTFLLIQITLHVSIFKSEIKLSSEKATCTIQT